MSTKPNLDTELDLFAEKFSKRYILKKKVNAFLCLFVAVMGTTAVLYSRFVFHNPLVDRLRYMTFWGTIFTAAVSFISVAAGCVLARKILLQDFWELHKIWTVDFF